MTAADLVYKFHGRYMDAWYIETAAEWAIADVNSGQRVTSVPMFIQRVASSGINLADYWAEKLYWIYSDMIDTLLEEGTSAKPKRRRSAVSKG